MVIPQPPGHLPAQSAKGRARSRRRAAVLLLAIAVVAVVVIVVTVGRGRVPGLPVSASYAAQPERNHMAIQATAASGLTDDDVAQISRNYTYVNLNANDAGGSLTGQSLDARRLVAANPAEKVFAYYRSSYTSEDFIANMAPYAGPFQDSWYLTDATGQKIVDQRGDTDADTQYFIDVGAPGYQDWLRAMLERWLPTGPWSGLKFDTTHYLVGSAPPAGGAYSQTVNDLLCGTGPWDQTGADCPRVQAWNDALEKQVESTSQWLATRHQELLFNGIAAGKATPTDRMLPLLASSGVSGALDESFCFESSRPGGKGASELTYTDIAADIGIMGQAAYASKILLFQTNYQTDDKRDQGDECSAAFLMGWVPGHDYYRFASNYTSNQLQDLPDPGRGFLPHNGTDELDLDIGDPTGAATTVSPTLMTRSFSQGFVAANLGDDAGTVTLPAAMTEFSDGYQGKSYAAGDTVLVEAHDGVFFRLSALVDAGHAPDRQPLAPTPTPKPDADGKRTRALGDRAT